MSGLKTEVLGEVAKASPSLTAVVLWATAKDVNFWLGAAGIAYIALQSAYLLWQWSWKRELRRKGMLPPKDA